MPKQVIGLKIIQNATNLQQFSATINKSEKSTKWVNMTIKQQMGVGIGSIVLMITLNVILGSMNSYKINMLVDKTSEESVPHAFLAADAKFQTSQIQQFLTDASLTQENDAIKEAESSYSALLKDMDAFEKMFKNEGDAKGLAEISEIKQDATKLLESGKQMKEAYARSSSEGNSAMKTFDEMSSLLADRINTLQDSQTKEAKDNLTTVIDKAQGSSALTLIVGFLSVSIGLLVGYFTVSIISRSVQILNSSIRTMADNKDLTHTISIPNKNELTEIADNINALISTLRQTFHTAQNAAAENISVSSELSSTSLSIGCLLYTSRRG